MPLSGRPESAKSGLSTPKSAGRGSADSPAAWQQISYAGQEACAKRGGPSMPEGYSPATISASFAKRLWERR